MPTKCSCCSLQFTGRTTCKTCLSLCCSTCRNEGEYGVCCSCAGDDCARGGGGGGGGGGRNLTAHEIASVPYDEHLEKLQMPDDETEDSPLWGCAKVVCDCTEFENASQAARDNFFKPKSETVMHTLEEALVDFADIVNEEKEVKEINLKNFDFLEEDDPLDIEWHAPSQVLTIGYNWEKAHKVTKDQMKAALAEAWQL